jgi:hypothetical protein
MGAALRAIAMTQGIAHRQDDDSHDDEDAPTPPWDHLILASERSR